MGSLLAVYYWNTGRDVLPTRSTSTSDVETTVPAAIRLNELVIVDLIEEETQPQVDIYYSRN